MPKQNEVADAANRTQAMQKALITAMILSSCQYASSLQLPESNQVYALAAGAWSAGKIRIRRLLVPYEQIVGLHVDPGYKRPQLT